ncbi:MAG TPA: helix-turn-helix domain-containing protein [Rubrobacteraceae bacterium]|nr:helix-turn-helix domain-containing protein [Rubrobacteraceae bacterium]
MRPYSKDLRLRVLAAVDNGTPRAEVAKTFGVSVSTIKRYLRLRRETGKVQPKPIPGPPPRKGAALRAWLSEQLRAAPNFTLEEYCRAFEEERGISVSTVTMSRAIRKLPGGWPPKRPSPPLSVTKRSEQHCVSA